MELKTKKKLKLRILSKPDKVFKIIQELWSDFPDYEKARENMFILYLDIKNRLLCVELHCQGTIDSLMVYPREVIRKSLFLNAGGIILVHNHPSNTNIPSNRDIEITKKLKTTCQIMDIKLLDHLIISDDNKYYSFQAEGDLLY